MPKLTLVSGTAAVDGSPQNTSERLINCFAEPSPEGAVSQFRIRPVLGTTNANPSIVGDEVGSVHAVATTQRNYFSIVTAKIYGLQGGKLRTWNEGGAAFADLGDVLSDTNANMVMSGQDVAIASGGTYYVWDESESSLETPGSGRFTAVGSVTYLNGYTILTKLGGQEFEWTSLGDPLDRNALYFATADARPDNLIRAMTAGGQLWLFGETSIEVWYLTGQAGVNAFARIPGAIHYTGLAEINAIVEVKNELMFVGDDNRVYLTSGVGMQAISNKAVEDRIAYDRVQTCFVYEHDGNLFGAVQTSGSTVIVDFRTGLWHERTDADGTAWKVGLTYKAGNSWYGILPGTNEHRKFTDRGVDYNGSEEVPFPRTIISRPFYNDGQQFSVSELEFLCEAGSTSESDPDVNLYISRDGGRTFGAPITRSIGASGEYEHRAVFRALGSYRNFTAKLMMDVADNVVMYSDANMRLS